MLFDGADADAVAQCDLQVAHAVNAVFQVNGAGALAQSAQANPQPHQPFARQHRGFCAGRGIDQHQLVCQQMFAMQHPGPVRVAAVSDEVALTIEPTGPLRLDLSFVTTLRDGVDLVDRLGVGVCIEVNSCFAERGLLDTVRVAADLVEHVQVSDFVIGSLCTPDRVVPGDGDIPLARILGGIVDAGYRGPFELEMVGPKIEDEGYASAITRGVAALDRILGEIPDAKVWGTPSRRR